MKFTLVCAGLLASALAAPSADLAKRELSELQSRAPTMDITERAALAELEARAPAALNTSREYLLRTQLKPNQPHKKRFEDLYVYSYHTGAGLGDAVLNSNRSVGNKGFLNTTKLVGPNGQKFYDQEFDLGNDFPWQMVPVLNANFYAAWEPVRINAGGGGTDAQSGFFINGTGLQWSNSPGGNPAYNQFRGWIVCKWWHEDISPEFPSGTGAPQLFFRTTLAIELPCSCADVYLMPEYI